MLSPIAMSVMVTPNAMAQYPLTSLGLPVALDWERHLDLELFSDDRADGGRGDQREDEALHGDFEMSNWLRETVGG